MIKEKFGVPEEVKLITVTKTRTVEEINKVIKQGVTSIGENRIQEAKEKFPELLPVEKHMIGHLQTNKAKLAVELFDMIQSVDSIKLAKEINKRSAAVDKVMPILIEVNIGNEHSKFGLQPEEVNEFLEELKQFVNLNIQGMMCIAPFIESEEVRPYFKRMKELFDSSGLKWLSMGMSNDYKVAIEEGSNMVRIGTAIFGQRKY